MRDFLEDLGKRLGETAETVTNKAGEAIEIQKLKSQIRGLARGNAVDLMELGRTIYDRYKAGEEVEEGAAALCEAIVERENSMEEYEKKIAIIRGSHECPSCGKMVAKDMLFCPYCGEKADFGEEESENESGPDYAEQMKSKMADAAQDVAEKAEKAAEKVDDLAHKAAEKTGEAAGKAADATGEFAEKAAEKIGNAAEKAAEKIMPKDTEETASGEETAEE